MGRRAELIEITSDNHKVLGRVADDIGYIAVRREGSVSTEAYADLTEALTAITDPLEVSPPEIGECLPVGSGRRWLTVPDDIDEV